MYLRLTLIVGALLNLTSCYILRQGTIFLSYYSRAESIEYLLEQDTLDPEIRTFLQQVQDIRTFAINDLGLDYNQNYTTYVDLDKEHLAYVVSASESTSFTPHLWSFPIVGRLPYKGFFIEGDARAEARRLKDKGLDVWIRRVDAFSTLGYFSDPIFSFMSDYRIHQLAELLIHEQAHATLFVKDHPEFNEEFATLVGKEGSRAYVVSRFGESSPEYSQMNALAADQQTFLNEVNRLIQILEELYSAPLSKEETLEKKGAIIREFQQAFRASYSDLFKTESYKAFADLPINNAFLGLYILYHPEESFLETLYLGIGRDLHRFIRAAKQIRGKRGDPYQLFQEALKQN